MFEPGYRLPRKRFFLAGQHGIVRKYGVGFQVVAGGRNRRGPQGRVGYGRVIRQNGHGPGLTDDVN